MSPLFLLIAPPFDTRARAQQHGHTHTWAAGGLIPVFPPSLSYTGNLYTDRVWGRGGEILFVRDSSAAYGEWDECTNVGTLCPMLWTALNWVKSTFWDEGGAMGQFGYIENGNFVPTGDASKVTHYRVAGIGQLACHDNLLL
jgi:hypothetical protein